MATINLDNDNVFTHELTLEQARAMSVDVMEGIEHIIDEAQGHVFQDRDRIAYVVIAIKR